MCLDSAHFSFPLGIRVISFLGISIIGVLEFFGIWLGIFLLRVSRVSFSFFDWWTKQFSSVQSVQFVFVSLLTRTYGFYPLRIVPIPTSGGCFFVGLLLEGANGGRMTPLEVHRTHSK